MLSPVILLGLVSLLSLQGIQCWSQHQRHSQNEDQYDCGVSTNTIPPSERVLEGRNISEGDYPWLVALLYNGSFNCGGSVISKNYILTAAHCLDDDLVNVTSYSVKVGSIDNTQVEDAIVAEKLFSHKTDILDVGVVKLSRPLEFNHTVQKVCLPSAYKESYEEILVAIGWGLDDISHKHEPQIAEENMIPVANPAECKKRFGFYYHNKSICAGAVNRGTESGDSGSPIMLNVKGRWWETGITSFGVELPVPTKGGAYDVGAYTRVDVSCSWITKVTEGEVKCLDMSQSPPVQPPTDQTPTDTSPFE